jgi:hypothetical protein
MTRPFLEVFPREIRDQIYTFVLASPSGVVTLSPWTLEVARSLSLVRTCKQIRRDCKDIIWLHNGLKLREPTQLTHKLNDLWKFRSVKYVQHLKIYLALLDRDELEWMSTAFQALAGWSRNGSLRSITLTAVRDRPRSVDEFHEELDLMIHGVPVDGRLYRESSARTTMVINTGWPQFSHWGKQMWLREMLLDPSQTYEFLKKMHDTLRGELWVDGVLCFKDQKQVVQAFNLDPRDGEVQFIVGGSSAR